MIMQRWVFTVCLLSLIVLGVVGLRQPQDDIRINLEESEILDFWLQKLLQESSGSLTTFKYNNCGDPNKEIANVTTLIIGPDPLVFPGPLTVQFAGTSRVAVQSPIGVALVIEIQVGSNWVKIPCIGQIGSCTYEDICELLAQITECPTPLVNAGIPCKCPFPQGSYNLPQTEFDITGPLFPAGDYHAVANITTKGNLVSCVELFATFG